MWTIVLLTASNIFMTIAWYGHLRFQNADMWKVVLICWGIAFFEYCLHVPANRMGYGQFSGFQLKIMQEVITLVVFVGFAFVYLHEPLRWNHLVSFGLILAAVWFAFLPGQRAGEDVPEPPGDVAALTEELPAAEASPAA